MEDNKIKKAEEESFNSSLDTEFNESKTGQGILFAFLLLIFSPIYGIVKYPKGTVARKTYLRANIITLVILIVLITIIAVLCVVIINLFSDIVVGTTEGIIGGVVDGATSMVQLIK